MSDPLKVPKTGTAMRAAGFAESDIETVIFANPVAFYAQSGRISLDGLGSVRIDPRRLWEDNSVRRGQAPVVVQE